MMNNTDAGAAAAATDESHPVAPAEKSAMDIDSLDYDPDVMARYIHFYKTG
eukprot:CAMPEP_0172326752 /NCGR_PEP_ID=MMETSP1058-20130122/57486_1 /TAXON_ID=83371 /ORGANISM="Detonula confervacea, Strain CCMP 353" /LENGTH=50 /DNA_ID=CAMNT_0013043613 /DNA_START=44 /DNA_END=192 /DNA_ORIENTATION=-